MRFADELTTLLPDNLPFRENVIAKSARHLEMIVEANRHFNLTRITDPRQAAIKHVLDSVVPWELFRLVSNERHVLDAGTGAGFPGIPLALVLPEVQFTLSESIQKKARFVAEAVRELSIPNITVTTERAETFLISAKTGIITARAVAPVAKAIELFGPALKQGARALLYKGPDIESELETAAADLRIRRLTARVIKNYELPDSLGSRTILELFAF